MTITFDFAALHYLNLWLSREREIHEAFTSGTEAEKLTAIGKGATYFVIARNLHTEYDTGKGLQRYRPVLDVIDPLTANDFRDNLAGRVMHIRDQISARYGNRDVLSATTKLLWLKIRSPIIIYDSQARQALDTADGDLAAYYDAWQAKFNAVRHQIAAARAELVDVLQYTADTSVATKPYVQSLAEEEWFNQRVLDIYLWHVGSS